MRQVVIGLSRHLSEVGVPIGTVNDSRAVQQPEATSMIKLPVRVYSTLVAIVCLLSAMPAVAQNAGGQADDLALAPRISLPEFKALLARGNVLVLDVRDVDSYKAGHIPGAVLLPLADIDQHADKLRAEKRPIVTYCA
jgi:predicted sulfurtransferase